MNFMLAAISGNNLLMALLWVVVGAMVYVTLDWGLTKIAPPPPFAKVGQVIIVLIAVAMIVNGLLFLVGRPFITF